MQKSRVFILYFPIPIMHPVCPQKHTWFCLDVIRFFQVTAQRLNVFCLLGGCPKKPLSLDHVSSVILNRISFVLKNAGNQRIEIDNSIRVTSFFINSKSLLNLFTTNLLVDHLAILKDSLVC